MSALISEAATRGAIAAAIVAQREVLSSELASKSDELKRGRVHRVRVATRRLLAALELAAALGTVVPREVWRALKELLDGLSPLRDAQVMVRALERLPAGEVDEAIVRRLRRGLKKQRRRARKSFSRLDRALVAELVSVSAATARPAAPSTPVLGDLSLSGALARQLLAIRELQVAAQGGGPHELHRLRLALKAYRYTLEVVSGQLSTSAAPLIEATSRLQDELGEAHDRQVLWKVIAEHHASHGGESSRRLVDALAHQSQEAHARAAESIRRIQLTWPFGDAPSADFVT